MAKVDKCPSCGNKNKGNEVYECRACGAKFCKNCGGSTFGDVCPRCNKPGTKTGTIGK